MDIRVLKTKKAISDSFLELRQTTPLHKIYVETLCQKAMINKSTFYRYYQDIYDLSEQLQQETIKAVLNNSKHIKELLTDSNHFIDESITLSLYDDLFILFEGQEIQLLGMLWESLEKIYLDNSLKKEVYIDLSFTLGGILFATKSMRKSHYTKEEILPEMKRIVALMVKEITNHMP